MDGTIAGWTPGELRRFIVSQVLTDPGALPKTNPTVAPDQINGDIAGSGLSLNVGTSPPLNPKSNDIWIYQGSGFYWSFVYDDTEATYKWKFVGGPPMSAYDETDVGTAGTTTFTDPSITVPRSGIYAVTWHVIGDNNPNAGTKVSWSANLVDVTAGGVSVGPGSIYSFVAAGAFNHWASFMGIAPAYLTLTAGHVLRLRVAPTNWDFISTSRVIAITPASVI